MTYTDQYNISNEKLVGRLLPWFARGRNLFYLLCGSLAPLKEVHDNFLEWAQEKHFEARLTFQVMSVEWYLNKQLSEYFYNSKDKFKIDLYAHKNYNFYLDTVANRNNSTHIDLYMESVAEAVVGTLNDDISLASNIENQETTQTAVEDTSENTQEAIEEVPETEDVVEEEVTDVSKDTYISAADRYQTIIDELGECPTLIATEGIPISYYRDEVTGSTTNRFNISAPKLKDSTKQDEYLNAIKKILSKYTMIRKYTIIIQDL